MKDDIALLPILETIQFPPDYIRHLAQRDYVHLSSSSLFQTVGAMDADALRSFNDSWNNLVTDNYMADQGKYRQRRHAMFSASRGGGTAHQEPHKPHFQTVRSNPINGGMVRNFAPIESYVANCDVLANLLNFGSHICGAISPLYDWEIEVHQFRILAQNTGVSPTPEGVHQDGVDFLMVVLIERNNIKFGQTHIFDLEHNAIAQIMLKNPFDVLITNDLRAPFEVRPIERDISTQIGYRDVLAVTFKREINSG